MDTAQVDQVVKVLAAAAADHHLHSAVKVAAEAVAEAQAILRVGQVAKMAKVECQERLVNSMLRMVDTNTEDTED